VGGASAGLIATKFGGSSVFVLGIAVMILWMVSHRGQNNPPAMSSLSLEINNTDFNAEKVEKILAEQGIREVVFMQQEKMLYLRFDSTQTDAAQVKQLVKQQFSSKANND
jgi:phosphoribosylformylglycinamidine (FGAM) synthase PurS component